MLHVFYILYFGQSVLTFVNTKVLNAENWQI